MSLLVVMLAIYCPAVNRENKSWGFLRFDQWQTSFFLNHVLLSTYLHDCIICLFLFFPQTFHMMLHFKLCVSQKQRLCIISFRSIDQLRKSTFSVFFSRIFSYLATQKFEKKKKPLKIMNNGLSS